jgi:hypothetical protein
MPPINDQSGAATIGSDLHVIRSECAKSPRFVRTSGERVPRHELALAS